MPLQPVHDQRGFSLIEILLSMVLLVMVGGVVIAMGSGTLVNAFSNQDRTRALSYTQEAVEQIRAFRDAQPHTFFNFGNGYYKLVPTDTPPLTLVGTSPPAANHPNYRLAADPRFYRVIHIVGDTEKKQVTVTTYFPEKSEYRSVSLVTYLTNWQ